MCLNCYIAAAWENYQRSKNPDANKDETSGMTDEDALRHATHVAACTRMTSPPRRPRRHKRALKETQRVKTVESTRTQMLMDAIRVVRWRQTDRRCNHCTGAKNRRRQV
jgi:hypothetical protein